MMKRGESSIPKVGIIGATGSTGVELAGLLAGHPGMSLEIATSRQLAGQPLTDIDPSAPAIELSAPERIEPDTIDILFLCLPHGTSAPIAADMRNRGARVVDLSGDLRLSDAGAHARAYGSERSQQLAEEAVYGLPELNRDSLRSADLVANPGCYATSVALAMLPLAAGGHLGDAVYVDAKSGVSGAGRAATPTTHFCSAHDDIRPYKVGRVHRHVPEMEQTLRSANGCWNGAIVFVPHLVPLERGILATCAVRGTGLLAAGAGEAGEARRLYESYYAGEPFVRVLPAGESARIRAAAHSNRAAISLHPVPEEDLLIVACAIDNLGKGAASQAIQNANLMTGRPETEGLKGWS